MPRGAGRFGQREKQAWALTSRHRRLASTSAAIALAAAFAAAAPDAQGAIVANFTDGNGTALPDQFAGTSGAGWATGWGSVGTTTGTGVVNTSPLAGGGNYLQVVDDATSTNLFVRRQYASAGEVNVAQPHTISLSYRFDGSIAQFTDFNDRIAIFGDTAAQTTSGATNTWLIGVAGSNTGAGAGQSVFPGEWYFFDNNGSNAFATSNMFDTNLPLVAGPGLLDRGQRRPDRRRPTASRSTTASTRRSPPPT